MQSSPFTVQIPQADLDDLYRRLQQTRWPNEVQPSAWHTGAAQDFMQSLTTYWREQYDWRTMEATINRYPQFTTTLRTLDTHYIHTPSQHPNAVPIVLLHGWPDSFYRYIHVINLLTRNNQPTTDDQVAFHVVIPSLPGYAFSAQPEADQMSPALAAAVVADLMDGLGYATYAVHGGDWGAVIAEELARTYPERVMALHLSEIPYGNFFVVDRDQASAEEQQFLDALDTWNQTEGGYVAIQSTRPSTLAYGLSDSPVGLAAWIVEKFHAWSETMPSHDDVLTNVMLYWFTNTIRSSFRLYNEGAPNEWDVGEPATAAPHQDTTDVLDDAGTDVHSTQPWASDGDAAGWQMRLDVPTAIALFPKDIMQPPRALAERFFDIRRFTVMERGGHFAALEVPTLLADDIRAFVRSLGMP